MAGQIYLPRVNWLLFVGVLLVVLIFRSSSELAAAYGVSVTATMVIDSADGVLRRLEAVGMAAVAGGRPDRAAAA